MENPEDCPALRPAVQAYSTVLCQGHYRFLYHIDGESRTVRLHRIDHRADVYR